MINYESQEVYPLVIIADRYGGSYSKGQFLAFNCDYHKLPREIDGGDIECMEFWKKFEKKGLEIDMYEGMQKIFCGRGNTPNQAIYNLQEQIENSKNAEANIKK